MMKTISISSLFLGILLLLTGCGTLGSSTSYTVAISCLSSGDYPMGAKYVLLPADPAVSVSDLHFKEFADYTERLLSQNFFRRIPVSQQAMSDMVIYLSYSISGPRQSFDTVSRPQFGTSGYQVMSGGYLAPVYGYTGYANEVVTSIDYTRQIILEAVKPGATSPADRIQLWKATITSTGTNSNLREVFPIMLAASQGFLPGNCNTVVQMNEMAKSIQVIRGLAPMPVGCTLMAPQTFAPAAVPMPLKPSPESNVPLPLETNPTVPAEATGNIK